MRHRWRIAGLAALLGGAVGCGCDRAAPSETVVRTTPFPPSSQPYVDPCGALSDPREEAVHTASCAALRYVVAHPSDDPLVTAYVDLVARRFGLRALEARWATAERTMPADERPAVRALQRLGDAEVGMPRALDVASLSADERLLVAALYCDTRPLDAADATAFRAVPEQPLLVRVRGFEALVVARDRGCAWPAGVTPTLIDRSASAVVDAVRGAPEAALPQALGIFLLRHAGYTRLAPRVMDDALLRHRNEDGSFGTGTPSEVVLTTAFSLGALLELRHGDRTETWATTHPRGRFERRGR